MSEIILQNNIKYLSAKPGCPAVSVDQKSVHAGISLTDAASLAEFASCTLDDLLHIDLQIVHHVKSDHIKMLVMDVDGVLADGGMYFTESGDELKRFSSRDGLALKKLGQHGFITAIISAGISKNAIEHRAAMLDIDHVYVGARSKFEILQKWCVELGVTLDQVAYIGDDLTDMPVLIEVGLPVCPSDAAVAVQKVAKVVLRSKGGQGCVREFIEDYLLPSLKEVSS